MEGLVRLFWPYSHFTDICRLSSKSLQPLINGRTFLIVFLLLSVGRLSAQVEKNVPLTVAKNARAMDSVRRDSIHHHRKLVPQKDITDELHFIFKKKPSDTVIKEVQKLTFSLLPISSRCA